MGAEDVQRNDDQNLPNLLKNINLPINDLQRVLTRRNIKTHYSHT